MHARWVVNSPEGGCEACRLLSVLQGENKKCEECGHFYLLPENRRVWDLTFRFSGFFKIGMYGRTPDYQNIFAILNYMKIIDHIEVIESIEAITRGLNYKKSE